MSFALIPLLLLVPFTYFFDGGQRIFLPYLIIAFIPVAIGAYRANGKRFNAQQIADFCFPDAIWKHPSSKLDRRFFFVNTILFTTLVVPYFTVSLLMNEWMYGWLIAGFGERDPASAPLHSTLILIICTVVFVLVSDFATFLAHYLQHRIPFLWEFHKIHHSAQVMTPLTVYRMHPVDDLMAYGLGGILNGGVLGLLHYAFAREPEIISVAGLSITTFIFYLCFYNLRHTHFWLHYGKLSNILISPAMHQIHHSEAQRHWDKNLGFIFSLWDKLFGTLYLPETKEELTLGIGDETQEYNSLAALYLLPFRKNWQRWRHKPKSGATADDGSTPRPPREGD